MGRISINYSLCGFNCFLDLVSLNFIIIQLTLNERKSNEWILKSLFDLNTVIVYLSSTRLGDDNVIGIRWRGGNCCSFMNVKKMIKTAFNHCIWTRIIAQLHTKISLINGSTPNYQQLISCFLDTWSKKLGIEIKSIFVFIICIYGEIWPIQFN